jgi:hypothetical protein
MVSLALRSLKIPAILMLGFCAWAPSVGRAESPVFRLEVEGAADDMPGIQPRPGESEAELNRRLLESFGPHPYGKPDPPEIAERREAIEARRIEKSRQDLLFRLEARALRRAGGSDDAPIPGLLPSRRFVSLSRTLKNPELLRDSLERRVQGGELSPYDLLDAEQGLFDATREEFVYDPILGFGYASGRRLPQRSIVRELLEYQTYIRAERYARQRP